MTTIDMHVLVRTLQDCVPGKLEAMIRDHTPDASGHCDKCHSVGCTLYTAARSALFANRTVQ